MSNHFKSSFACSEAALSVLRNGNIISEDENPQQMVERVVAEIERAETELLGVSARRARKFSSELGQMMDASRIVFSTPVLTNAGLSEARPLSACAVPPIDLRQSMESIKRVVDNYHREAIGTGFCLDDLEDPVSALSKLNAIAVAGAASGLEKRPVGNMAVLSIMHPRIRDFIKSKMAGSGEWKFNIAVNVNDGFMYHLRKGERYALANGSTASSIEIFDLLATANFVCGDPGLLFMDRINRDNPVPALGAYTSVAPCAEVGLAPGESCQFGYLNLGAFVCKEVLDLAGLRKAVELLVRALDDALEVSISRYTVRQSAQVMRDRRKIGVGICGLADLLACLSVAYDSEAGRLLARDVLALINYISKEASFQLARERGSFLAFEKSRYVTKPGFLEDKYGGLETSYVSKSSWARLADRIRKFSALRNCSTVSLPPTGRSGLVVSASTGVEPYFNLFRDGHINPYLLGSLEANGCNSKEVLQLVGSTGSCRGAEIPTRIKEVFKTATEIHPHDHMKMVGAIQPTIDESVSKTINLPVTVSINDIKHVFLDAYYMNLKGVTVYVNHQNRNQPIALAE